MTKTFELCVSSSLKTLAEISDFVVSVADKWDIGDTALFAMQMAVDEACANVIEHAYGGSADGTICVTLRAESGDAIITIRDRGHPFDPSGVPRPDPTAPLEKRGEGALGLYLMERLMDSVAFHFDAVEGNTLIMKKRLHGADETIGSEH